jgi:transposase-like protein
MLTEKPQTSTAECKRAAVRLIPAQRDGVAATARYLGRHVPMLRRWQQAYIAHTPAAFPGNGRLTPEQGALRQLRDAGKRLRMERDI